MIKKIPGSSLPLILISLVGLYLTPWLFIILRDLYGSGTDVPYLISILIIPILAFIPILIVVAAFLYLKRDKPTGVPRVLSIIAPVLIVLHALYTLMPIVFLFYGPPFD